MIALQMETYGKCAIGINLEYVRGPTKQRRHLKPVTWLVPKWQGVASSTFAPNQNLQTSGVTNVVTSQAMTAIPLPMER